MKKLIALFLSIACLPLLGFSSSALALPKQSSFEQDLSTLENQTNDQRQKVFRNLGNYERNLNNSKSIVKTARWIIESPLNVEEPVRIRNRHGLFAVAINQESPNTSHYDFTRGPRSYEFADGSSISPIVKNDGSVQFVAEVPDSDSSHRFTYSLDLPRGMRISLDPPSNLVYITNEKGDFIGGLAPAWATDAKGKSVKTWYEITDKQVIQVIDKTQSEITYPVIADPWLGFDLIFRSFWAATTSPPNPYAPTLAVYPTDWGRTVAGATTFPIGGFEKLSLDSLAVRAAWDETLSKTSRSGYPNPNTSSMYHQFECHFFYVSKLEPKKPSWNLDI